MRSIHINKNYDIITFRFYSVFNLIIKKMHEVGRIRKNRRYPSRVMQSFKPFYNILILFLGFCFGNNLLIIIRSCEYCFDVDKHIKVAGCEVWRIQ